MQAVARRRGGIFDKRPKIHDDGTKQLRIGRKRFKMRTSSFVAPRSADDLGVFFCQTEVRF